MNEKLSALVDSELNELDERRVLESMKNDLALRCSWERYHLIRAAMTRQLSVVVSPGMSERVRVQLESEQQAATALRFWPLAGGFAAAASVAVLAIFGLQTLREPGAPLNTATVAVNANAPIAATPVSASAAPLTPDERLDAYLVGHNEFMPTGGMGNMLPYVRVVADTPDR